MGGWWIEKLGFEIGEFRKLGFTKLGFLRFWWTPSAAVVRWWLTADRWSIGGSGWWWSTGGRTGSWLCAARIFWVEWDFFHFSVERDREKKETEKYKGSGKIARGSDAKFDVGCSKSNSYKGRTIDEGRSTSNSYGNIHTRTFKYSILQFNSSLISLIHSQIV